MPHKDSIKSKQYQKEYYFKNRDKKLKAKEFQRKRYLKHQEFKKQYAKEWRLKNKHLYNADKIKDKLLLTTYKI